MKTTYALAAVLSTSLAAQAGAAKTGFLERIHKGSDGDAKYVLFVPHGYKAEKEYPLILFLHGAGETGTDGEKQVKVGLGPAIKKQQETFGFFAVFPQSQNRTWKADSDDGQRARARQNATQAGNVVDDRHRAMAGKLSRAARRATCSC